MITYLPKAVNSFRKNSNLYHLSIVKFAYPLIEIHNYSNEIKFKVFCCCVFFLFVCAISFWCSESLTFTFTYFIRRNCASLKNCPLWNFAELQKLAITKIRCRQSVQIIVKANRLILKLKAQHHNIISVTWQWVHWLI